MPRKKKIQEAVQVQSVPSDVDDPPILPPEDDIELPPDNPLCPVRYIGGEMVVVCGPYHFPPGEPVAVEPSVAESLIRSGKFEAA